MVLFKAKKMIIKWETAFSFWDGLPLIFLFCTDNKTMIMPKEIIQKQSFSGYFL